MKKSLNLIYILTSITILSSCSTTVTTKEFQPSDNTAINGRTEDLVIIFNGDTQGRTIGEPITSGIKDYYEHKGKDVLTLNGGDAIHGQTIATLTEGQAIIDIMNRAQYDAFVPGNHEFNYGYQRLLELEEVADFDFLCANVAYDDGTLLFDPYEIYEFGDASIGVFGITTPETAEKTNSSNVQGIQFLNPIETARSTVQKLEQDGTDYIIMLSHLGTDISTPVSWQSSTVAQEVDGIDLIVDGDSNLEQKEPTVINDTLLVQSSKHYENISIITIKPDNTYDIQYIDPILEHYDTIPEKISKYVPDPKVQVIIDKYNSDAENITTSVVSTTDVFLDGERENVRTHETNLTTLLTDAILSETGADLALTNAGSTRESIDIGEITQQDINNTWPFGNTVVTMQVTGQEFVDAIEYGLSDYPEPVAKFPHIGGAIIEFDPQLQSGSRITSITMDDGSAFDYDSTYTLALNKFIVNGGDGYSMFLDNNILQYYEIQSDIVINYLQKGNDVPRQASGRLTAK